MGKGRALRLTFALALLPTGAVLVLVAGSDMVGQLISNLGFALIVAGAVSGFRELAILRLESEETAEEIAARVHKRILESLPGDSGIRMVSPVRRGYAGYYTWALATDASELFFAGRSVLHRIDRDFRTRGLGSAEAMLARRLTEGANIRVLFIDPRSDIIDRLAKEEGQTSTAMLSDIATSIGICRRLHGLLQGHQFAAQPQLCIRVYDEVPYFAWHKEDEKVIVGFYFATALGSMSAAFEVVDIHTQRLFEGHFTSIFDRASVNTLLELSTHRESPRFNEGLYEELLAALTKRLGEETTSRLISGNT